MSSIPSFPLFLASKHFFQTYCNLFRGFSRLEPVFVFWFGLVFFKCVAFSDCMSRSLNSWWWLGWALVAGSSPMSLASCWQVLAGATFTAPALESH